MERVNRVLMVHWVNLVCIASTERLLPVHLVHPTDKQFRYTNNELFDFVLTGNPGQDGEDGQDGTHVLFRIPGDT